MNDDKKYGIPEQKKFPMPDAAHVRSAIRFFNYVEPRYEKKLAKAILARMKEYGLSFDDFTVGEENRFSKYIPENELKHYGITGQEWGVRRYQDENGTWLKAGLERRRARESGTNAVLRITGGGPSSSSRSTSSSKSSTSTSSKKKGSGITFTDGSGDSDDSAVLNGGPLGGKTVAAVRADNNARAELTAQYQDSIDKLLENNKSDLSEKDLKAVQSKIDAILRGETVDLGSVKEKKKEETKKETDKKTSSKKKNSKSVKQSAMQGNYLQHYGILGMHWGIRRYQNEDGTLTEAGKRHYAKLDDRWADKHATKIQNKAYKKSQREMKKVERQLRREFDPRGRQYMNAYNQNLARIMSTKVTDLSTPSGKAVKFVAKRGEYGVYFAMASRNYDMNKVKNGVWGSGRVAYKNTILDKSESRSNRK